MERKVNIRPFFDEDGRIKQLPQKLKTRRAVLAKLAEQFAPGRDYTELEVNGICTRWHTFDDYFLLRRELVDNGFLDREPDGSRYWRVPEAEKNEEE